MSVEPVIIVDFKEYLLDETSFPGPSSIQVPAPMQDNYKREFFAVLDASELHDRYDCDFKELKEMIDNEKYIEKIELTLTLDATKYNTNFPAAGTPKSTEILIDKRKISIQDDKFLIIQVLLDPKNQTYCFLNNDFFTFEIELKRAVNGKDKVFKLASKIKKIEEKKKKKKKKKEKKKKKKKKKKS